MRIIKKTKTLIILLMVPVFFYSGCRSLSPLSTEPTPYGVPEAAEPGGRGSPPERLSFDDFYPDWQPFAREEGPGLFYAAARTRNPRLEFWALRADLSVPSLKVVVNGPEDADGIDKSQGIFHRIRSTKVSSFVRDYGLLAGINTVPFDPVSAKEGEERFCVGIVVSDGNLLAPPVSRYDALIFYRAQGAGNRRAAIVPQGEIQDLDLVENALGGFHIILSEGELPDWLVQDLPRQDLPRHPRSAAGLSADGNTLYLLVIDGRRPGSAGATEAETGLILKKLGAAWGLNFDGGGSSALALRYPDGRTRTVNTPVHGNIPGRERAVAACLGLGFERH